MKGTIWVVLRLLLTAALVFVTYLGVRATKSFLRVPPIRQLSLDIRKLPLKLGDWAGEEDKQLDPEIFTKTGAKVTVDRAYRDAEGHQVTLYLATFDDPDEGVYHSPTNCYRSHGWQLVEESKVDVPIPGGPVQQVSVSTWEKKNETILVMFWYRLGDSTLFERFDLGRVRWAMRGQQTWPPLVKVLLETPTPRRDDFHSRERIREVASQIQQWLDRSNAGGKAEGVGK